MKFCKRCKQEKSLDAFHNDKYRPDGKTSICGTCRCSSQIKYRDYYKTPAVRAYRRRLYKVKRARYLEVNFKSRIKQTYGLTVLEYNKLVNGKCSICEITATPLVIDHDHVTGKVRGVLCPKCNSGLGFFRDNTNLLHKAILYLENRQFTVNEILALSSCVEGEI